MNLERKKGKYMIEITNLEKHFKKAIKEPGLKGSVKSLFSRQYEVVKAVDGVSFSVPKGEILGFIGPNGAGKSTVIKMMTGILTPTKGTIEINGKIPYEDRKRYVKEIGVVFGQRTQLWWDLPLTETFSVLAQIYNVSDEDFKKKMTFFNEVLEIDKFIKSPVRTLSLGQRMRADIAASMLHSPKVLFLDEPTIGLDVVVKDNIRKAIQEINRSEETTIVLTTHDLSDIELLCNRIVMIDKGKIVYDGSLEKMKSVYGEKRQIHVLMYNETDFDNVNINEHFTLNENDCNISKNGCEVIVNFNARKIEATQLLTYILNSIKVKDISVSDVGIEEIIMGMYKSEV